VSRGASGSSDQLALALDFADPYVDGDAGCSEQFADHGSDHRSDQYRSPDQYAAELFFAEP
jgi:hypothetical protein